MAHFPFQFVEQFREVECGGAGNGTFDDPFLHGCRLGNADVAMDDCLKHKTRSKEVLNLLRSRAFERFLRRTFREHGKFAASFVFFVLGN